MVEFEDLHEYQDKGFYLVPNETTTEWRELVKGLHINRAAAICSSGEVGLIALLPTVRKELVLIDHSYASLSVAMLKFLMLKELGAKETHRLLTTAEGSSLREKLNELLPQLPEAVRTGYANHVIRGYGGFTYNSNLEWLSIDGKLHPKHESSKPASNLVREWNSLPKRAVRRCATKLDKVKFVHGDLTDLKARGPFDLLYLSNAMDHFNRDKVQPSWEPVLEALRPGGYVILAHRPYNVGSRVETIMKSLGLESVSSTITSKGMAWTQSLYRVPVKQEVAA